MGLPQLPLFPVQNVRLPGPPATPIAPPGTSTATPTVTVSQPLFPVVPNNTISVQGSPFSAPLSLPLSSSSEIEPQFGGSTLPFNSYHTPGIPGSSFAFDVFFFF